MAHRYVKIEKCIECAYPTKERHKPIPDGKASVALCRTCQKRITKPKTPFDALFDEIVDQDAKEYRRVKARRATR